MHERYSHPSLAFLITWCILQKRPILGIMASVAYFLNLEAELKFLQLPHYGTLIFDPEFISVLWLLVIAGLYVNLYKTGNGKAGLTGLAPAPTAAALEN
jgi:hypothetical protein